MVNQLFQEEQYYDSFEMTKHRLQFKFCPASLMGKIQNGTNLRTSHKGIKIPLVKVSLNNQQISNAPTPLPLSGRKHIYYENYQKI
jgi:hypothetical protein